ncbi:MAG: aspartyl/glutamyl-tRNA(Asn/Gln) amidotransferase subunit, partial [Deltaproteobacteria bacterium]|nr:aspartyl/glutamyl-tRNA(Asn/Gln) amidotransferase subunit [Deltaproteobacteria bacterium]
GINAEGLPIGMQLIGSWYADQIVLNAALAFQDGTDWHTRRPALASA